MHTIVVYKHHDWERDFEKARIEDFDLTARSGDDFYNIVINNISMYRLRAYMRGTHESKQMYYTF